MNLDILKILEPYKLKETKKADSSAIQKYQSSLSRLPTSTLSGSTNRFGNIKPTPTISSTKDVSRIPARQITENKFAVYHKKPAIQFKRTAESIACNRKRDFNQGVKDRRFELMNRNRGIATSTTSVSVEKADKATKYTAKNSRMAQLQRWKTDKAELHDERSTKPLPFKAGSAPISSRLGNGLTSKTKNGNTTQPIKSSSVIRIKGKSPTPSNQSDHLNFNDRRITRAMSALTITTKVTCSASTNASDGPNRSKNTKLITGKDRNEPAAVCSADIVKPRTRSVRHKESLESTKRDAPMNTEQPNSKSETLITKPSFSTAHVADENIPPPLPAISLTKSIPVAISYAGGITRTPNNKKTSGIPQSQMMKSGGNTHSPAIKKAKKPKGMQFDAVYKEFNGKFVDECSSLIVHVEKWVKILNEQRGDIPDDGIGEIDSCLGQAKLLMESKLPQFAELLYFYLSRTQNPHQILPCDLEGWWDVAAISIDKVKGRFQTLEKISKKDWKLKLADQLSSPSHPQTARSPLRSLRIQH